MRLPHQDPELRGAAGMAWQYDIDAISAKRRARHPNEAQPPRELSIASWLVHAPAAHPAWHSYSIYCISLRDVPGFPPAVIHLPGATHEVMVLALNPDFPMAVDEQPRHLTPSNFHGQFIEPSDEAAAARIRAVVQEVVDGVLSPDTDFRQQWVERFSASNFKRDKPLDDHLMLLPDGSVVAVGTGKAMTEMLQQASAAGIEVKAETKQ